jgi:hypothetical protein
LAFVQPMQHQDLKITDMQEEKGGKWVMAE